MQQPLPPSLDPTHAHMQYSEWSVSTQTASSTLDQNPFTYHSLGSKPDISITPKIMAYSINAHWKNQRVQVRSH